MSVCWLLRHIPGDALSRLTHGSPTMVSPSLVSELIVYGDGSIVWYSCLLSHVFSLSAGITFAAQLAFVCSTIP